MSMHVPDDESESVSAEMVRETGVAPELDVDDDPLLERLREDIDEM